MYGAVADPYCYPGTTVLRNRLELRDQGDLEAFEADAVTLRAEQPFPSGRVTPSHYRAVHRHLFQDVYRWAGCYRTVRIAKGGSVFCYPEHIAWQLADAFSRLVRERVLVEPSPDRFATKAAHFLPDLNAIHAFRDGNGRAQLAFFAALCASANRPLNLARLEPERFLAAMITSFRGDEKPLAGIVRQMI